jgi:bacterial regulatory protein, arsR family
LFVFKEVILEQKSKITIAQRWILSEITKNKEMTLKDLMKITEIKETTLKIYLSRLVQLGLIASIRVSGQETIYAIKKGKKSNGKKES